MFAIILTSFGEGLYQLITPLYLNETGISVTNTGHCHPRVVNTAKKQLNKLIHCSGVY